jgi:WD40 repeat protein
VAFNPDGTILATGSTDGTTKVWNVRTGALITTLTGRGHGVNAVAFSPDGTMLATAGEDDTVKLWGD